MPKVLIVATSRHTRGGITSVVNAHSQCAFWEKYHARWIETHRDKNFLIKIWYAIKSLVLFICVAPTYDIIHIHLSEFPSALRKTPFFLIGKLYRKKVIIHFHSFSPKTTIEGKYRFLYSFLFKNSDQVIVLSALWKKWIKEAFRSDKNICIIYNPCLPPAYPAYANIAKEPIILYAGSICDRKGYRDLLNGFASIAKKYPQWKLVFAGNGEIETGKQLADQLNISSQVEFAGWVTGDNKEKLFARASIFCLPSYAEGFPMAVLDAFSFNLPLITTPVGGIPDFIVNEQNGLLFDPGDIRTLTNQLDKLVSDNRLREKLGQQSHLFAENTFNLKTIDQQIDSLYSFILEQ